MGRSLKCICAALVVCGAQAVAAHAATLDLFTFSLSGTPGTGTATIAAAPTPISFMNGTSFTLSNITASYLGSSYTGDVSFFEIGGAGGQGAVFGGDKLFTGPDFAPVFRTGTFTLRGNVDLGLGNAPAVGTLMISSLATPAATPEPGTLAMVGTAALGFAGMLRRRFA